MLILSHAAIAALAYLLGSIPTGFLVGKARGIDIRAVGSGNIGATNALRILGKPAGIAVLLIDILKGWTAVVAIPRLVQVFLGGPPDESTLQVQQLIAGFCAVLGHNYTCWLNFKGGKGIATSAGVLVALVPWALLTILTVWILLFAISRVVSVGSIAASATLPFATYFFYRNWTLTLVTTAMAVLAIYKHRANIQRLLAGTEPRIGAKPKEATP